MKKLLTLVSLLLLLALTLSMVACTDDSPSHPEGEDDEVDDTPDKPSVLFPTEGLTKCATVGDTELYLDETCGAVYALNTKTKKAFATNPSHMAGDATTRLDLCQVIATYAVPAEDGSGTYVTSPNNIALSYLGERVDSIVSYTPTSDGVTVRYNIAAIDRYMLPYSMTAKDMIEIILAPMQQKIEQDLHIAATAAGVPEKYLQKFFDYEGYYASLRETFSTVKMLGEEFVFGNIEAFSAWLRNAENFYKLYYRYSDYEVIEDGRDPSERRSEEEQRNMLPWEDLNTAKDDYLLLTTLYTLVTPYWDYRGDTPEDWRVAETALKLYPILNEMGTHPTLNLPYYKNAFFVISLDVTKSILTAVQEIFTKYVDGFTLADCERFEGKSSITGPYSDDHIVMQLDLNYRITGDSVTLTMKDVNVAEGYRLNTVTLLPGNSDNEGTVITYEEAENPFERQVEMTYPLS